MLSEHQVRQRHLGIPYDCIIPVSGGKDSHYQVYVAKQKLGLNPLLVTANHTWNTPCGLANLRNLVTRFGCDLVRFTISPESARKVARWALLEMGDITFAYHASIMCWPMRAAVQWRVPMVVWGEEGFSQLTGMFQVKDEVEYTRWKTLQHDQRGYDREDLIGRGDPGHELTWRDVEWMRYPSVDEIQSVGLRGIYLSNYLPWDAHAQARAMHERYGFGLMPFRYRSYRTYSKTDDAANDVHDLLKFLKFGYGRGTDDASEDIRYGRLNRHDGLELSEFLDRQMTPLWRELLGLVDVPEDRLLIRLGELADGGAAAVEQRWQALQVASRMSFRAAYPALYAHLEHGRPLWTGEIGAIDGNSYAGSYMGVL